MRTVTIYCSAHEQAHLDVFRYHHCLEAAQRGVGNREDGNDQNCHIHIHAEKALEHPRCGEHADADVYQEGAQQADDGEECARLGAVTLLHNSWRVDTRVLMWKGANTSASSIGVKHALHSKLPITIPSLAPRAARPTMWMVEISEVRRP